MNESQAKLPAMRELIGVMQQRADRATKELPKSSRGRELVRSRRLEGERQAQPVRHLFDQTGRKPANALGEGLPIHGQNL